MRRSRRTGRHFSRQRPRPISPPRRPTARRCTCRHAAATSSASPPRGAPIATVRSTTRGRPRVRCSREPSPSISSLHPKAWQARSRCGSTTSASSCSTTAIRRRFASVISIRTCPSISSMPARTCSRPHGSASCSGSTSRAGRRRSKKRIARTSRIWSTATSARAGAGAAPARSHSCSRSCWWSRCSRCPSSSPAWCPARSVSGSRKGS